MAIPLNLPQRSYIRAIYHLENDGTDSGLYGYNLINENGVTFTPAKINNGANFGSPNTNKRLHIDNHLGITDDRITMSFWIKHLAEISSGSYQIVWHINDVNDVSYGIFYEYNSGTRRLYFQRVRQYVAVEGFYYNITMGNTNWYHIAITYNGSTYAGFVNGSLANSTSLSGIGSGTTFNRFLISEYTPSIVDEVIVWNKALSASEIVQVYNLTGYILGGRVAIGSPMIF